MILRIFCKSIDDFTTNCLWWGDCLPTFFLVYCFPDLCLFLLCSSFHWFHFELPFLSVFQRCFFRFSNWPSFIAFSYLFLFPYFFRLPHIYPIATKRDQRWWGQSFLRCFQNSLERLVITTLFTKLLSNLSYNKYSIRFIDFFDPVDMRNSSAFSLKPLSSWDGRLHFPKRGSTVIDRFEQLSSLFLFNFSLRSFHFIFSVV